MIEVKEKEAWPYPYFEIHSTIKMEELRKFEYPRFLRKMLEDLAIFVGLSKIRVKRPRYEVRRMYRRDYGEIYDEKNQWRIKSVWTINGPYNSFRPIYLNELDDHILSIMRP